MLSSEISKFINLAISLGLPILLSFESFNREAIEAVMNIDELKYEMFLPSVVSIKAKTISETVELTKKVSLCNNEKNV